MEFKVHTTESAPEASREPLRAIAERYGFLPNLAGAFAESPVTLEALLSLLSIQEGPKATLSTLERQVVLLSVSAENGCEYCTTAHTMLATKAGLDSDQIGALLQGRRLSDGRLDALRRFTRAVVRERGRPSGDDMRSFKAAGFRPDQALEVVLGVALKTLTNYVNHLVETPVNEEFMAFHPENLVH